MNLVRITVSEVEGLDPILFPLVREYLDRGSPYDSDEECVWFLSTVDVGNGVGDPLVGAICLTAHRMLPNSINLSVLEVRSDSRGMGYGSEMMNLVEEMVGGQTSVAVITLQTREPGLISFYSRFGYRQSGTPEGVPFMRKYITR